MSWRPGLQERKKIAEFVFPRVSCYDRLILAWRSCLAVSVDLMLAWILRAVVTWLVT